MSGFVEKPLAPKYCPSLFCFHISKFLYFFSHSDYRINYRLKWILLVKRLLHSFAECESTERTNEPLDLATISWYTIITPSINIHTHEHLFFVGFFFHRFLHKKICFGIGFSFVFVLLNDTKKLCSMRRAHNIWK